MHGPEALEKTIAILKKIFHPDVNSVLNAGSANNKIASFITS
jgi:hypothetical protein